MKGTDMIFIANVATDQHTYNVHLEVSDDDAGRAKVAEALSDIQQRFLPRAEQPKKQPPPRISTSSTARSTQPQPGGEGSREK
jgi:hypothetical protein